MTSRKRAHMIIPVDLYIDTIVFVQMSQKQPLSNASFQLISGPEIDTVYCSQKYYLTV